MVSIDGGAAIAGNYHVRAALSEIWACDKEARYYPCVLQELPWETAWYQRKFHMVDRTAI